MHRAYPGFLSFVFLFIRWMHSSSLSIHSDMGRDALGPEKCAGIAGFISHDFRLIVPIIFPAVFLAHLLSSP
jgi:hypothetical protein